MPITKREKANLIKQIDDLSWYNLADVYEIINDMPETENVWLDKPDTLCTDWWYKSTTGIVFKVFVDIFLTEKDNPLDGQPICVINGVTKDISRLDGKWARITPPESEG